MTPPASSAAARRRMKSARQADTACELTLRSELHRRGLRYRVDYPVVGSRRRADVVFTRARLAVFVDGCFWHCCPEHATWPKANSEWWKTKLDANVARDRDTDQRLRKAGWRVLRVWEHENMERAAEAIARIIRSAAP